MDGIEIYELDYPTHEGVRLPKVEPLLRDAGKVINDIQDLKLGPEAVILATFPRSGRPNLITCSFYSYVAGLSIY